MSMGMALPIYLMCYLFRRLMIRLRMTYTMGYSLLQTRRFPRLRREPAFTTMVK